MPSCFAATVTRWDPREAGRSGAATSITALQNIVELENRVSVDGGDHAAGLGATHLVEELLNGLPTLMPPVSASTMARPRPEPSSTIAAGNSPHQGALLCRLQDRPATASSLVRCDPP